MDNDQWIMTNDTLKIQISGNLVKLGHICKFPVHVQYIYWILQNFEK